jgi:amidase
MVAEDDSSKHIQPSRKTAPAQSGAASQDNVAQEASPVSRMPTAPDLCFKTAVEFVDLVRQRDLRVVDVLAAHLQQIERVNPRVNAICTLQTELAVEQATRMDEALARSEWPGPLCGLPIAIKDLVETKGIRTTFGSSIYRDHVPNHDALFVERLKAAGAIVIGKTNTPEFGAGSHTFNRVFGVTRNPYDLDRSSGGSSGGGAAALACGMIPIADGSDLGGSVRNPPSFNNVVGLRPSPGRIPRYPNDQPWDTLSVLGPMARTVQDAALLLSVMAGPDARDPISITEDPRQFLAPLQRDSTGRRIAWSSDLGQFPVQSAIVNVIENALPQFTELGCIVEEAHPDFSGAADIFQVLRAHNFAYGLAKDLKEHRELMKDTVIWNIEQGLKLAALEVAQAQAGRAALFHRVRTFLEHYDFLLLPVCQVVPFPVEVEWVQEINGIEMATYIDWMMSCSLITLTGHPAISVPCGFTADGLPVGLQIVGPYRGEFELLQFAYAFEQATHVADRRPPVTLPQVKA